MSKKKFLGVIIALFVVSALVIVAGNTYVTASGIWLGYRWHPINPSQQNDTAIKTGSASVKQMNDIVDVIYNDGSISNRTSGDGYKTIKKIDKIAKIEEFRELYFDDSYGSYCVFENDRGGKFVVAIYGLSTENKKQTNDNCIPDGAFYMEKPLLFEDFQDINVGSDRDDVLKIDPAMSVNMDCLIEEKLETSENHSIHITKEGYIEIKYDGDGKVEEITKNENDMIKKVMAAEF